MTGVSSSCTWSSTQISKEEESGDQSDLDPILLVCCAEMELQKVSTEEQPQEAKTTTCKCITILVKCNKGFMLKDRVGSRRNAVFSILMSLMRWPF